MSLGSRAWTNDDDEARDTDCDGTSAWANNNDDGDDEWGGGKLPRSAISYAGIDDGNGAAASADFPATCMFRCLVDGYARSVIGTGASGDRCSAILGLWCGDGEEYLAGEGVKMEQQP